MIRRTITAILLVGLALGQPELRFHPFDWVQYRQTGKVNSISFGDRYAYIGTQSGGVLRFNRYSERFEAPITRAQGLRSNTITAVHRSSNGILWAASPLGVEFSFTEEGDWRFIDRYQLNLPLGIFVERIGESDNNVWLDTPGLIYKLDAITGIVVGIMPNPDEAVTWSSGLIRFRQDLSDLFIDYSFMDGWMTDLQSLIHPDGRQMNVTTLIKNNFNEVWIGTEDGTFFRGDNTMKTFTPFDSAWRGMISKPSVVMIHSGWGDGWGITNREFLF